MAKPKALKSYLSSFYWRLVVLFIKYKPINHIDRITEACKQRNKSVYMLFWLFRTFLQSLFISNATNPPFTLGLRVKGDKRARLTSFPRQKGGEKHETIFFSDHNRKSV